MLHPIIFAAENIPRNDLIACIIHIPHSFIHRNHPPYIIILINVHCPLNKYSECTARLQDSSRIIEWLRKRVFRLFVCSVNVGGGEVEPHSGWVGGCPIPYKFIPCTQWLLGTALPRRAVYETLTPVLQYRREPHSNMDPSAKEQRTTSHGAASSIAGNYTHKSACESN